MTSSDFSVDRRGERQRPLGVRARFAAVLALVLSGLVLGAGPALAHDQIVQTNPKDGASVKRLPDEIELVFSSNPLALGSVVRVESPDGDVTEGKPKIVDETLTQAIAAGAPAGKYTVQWRVTSSDGHPISGEFTFTAEAGNEPSEPAEPTGTAGGAATTEPAEPTEASEPTAVAVDAGASLDNQSDGTSSVLIVTLLVLALVVIGAVVYVFVLAPRRSGEN